MPKSPTPIRDDTAEESEDGPREPERRSNWSSTLVSMVYALATLLGAAAAVITALSGWDRI